MAGEEDVCVASEEVEDASEEAEDASEEGVASAAGEDAGSEEDTSDVDWDEVESDDCEAPFPLPQKVMRRLTWMIFRESYSEWCDRISHHPPGTEPAPGSRWR